MLVCIFVCRFVWQMDDNLYSYFLCPCSKFLHFSKCRQSKGFRLGVVHVCVVCNSNSNTLRTPSWLIKNMLHYISLKIDWKCQRISFVSLLLNSCLPLAPNTLMRDHCIQKLSSSKSKTILKVITWHEMNVSFHF